MKIIFTFFVSFLVFASSLVAFSGTSKHTFLSSPPAKLSAYLVAKPQDPSIVKSNLEGYGFKVLSSYSPYPGKTVISITNSELKKTGTFMAVINVLVSKSEVRVQNPSYLGAAYLGKKYHYGQFKNTVNMLKGVLGELYNVKEALAFDDLKHYHFMFGMPYFADMITISNSPKQPKSALYKLKLPNGNTIVGHKLANNSFLKKIKQTKNAALLPYQSMITSSKVVILHPKYYLALSLPLLKMGNFMTISSAPGEIEDEIKKAYN